MRSLDFHDILAEFYSNTLNNSILEFIFRNIAVFVHPIESKILSSIDILHIQGRSSDGDSERSYAIYEFDDSIIVFLIGKISISKYLCEFLHDSSLDIARKEHRVVIRIGDLEFTHYQIPIFVWIIQ